MIYTAASGFLLCTIHHSGKTIRLNKLLSFQTSHLIQTHGQRDIGEVVRGALKSVMTDTLMLNYNRTGCQGKKQISPTLVRCLYSKL